MIWGSFIFAYPRRREKLLDEWEQITEMEDKRENPQEFREKMKLKLKKLKKHLFKTAK